jgi:hypothetical protein
MNLSGPNLAVFIRWVRQELLVIIAGWEFAQSVRRRITSANRPGIRRWKRVEITVNGIKARIDSIDPSLPSYLNLDPAAFYVWLSLKDPLPGTGVVKFGVTIPPMEYSKESFTETVIKAAEIRAATIMNGAKSTQQLREDGEMKKKKLQTMIDELKKKLE